VKYSRPVLLSTKMNTLTYDSVGNLAHVHFSANVFALPLKSAENPRGIFSEQELYMIVAVISTAIFFDFEPTKSFALRPSQGLPEGCDNVGQANRSKCEDCYRDEFCKQLYRWLPRESQCAGRL
jgi:hypothetical protein